MKKKYVVAIIIVIALVIAVASALIFNKLQKENNVVETNTGTVSVEKLPVIEAYYGDDKIVSLEGYTMEMSSQYMRDVIIPVGPDKKIPLEIKSNSNKIQIVTYEVRSNEDNRLVDSGEVSDWTDKDGTLSMDIMASATMEPDTEYQLIFKLITENSDTLYYYTRIMTLDKEFVSSQVKFAKDYSNAVFGAKNSVSISNYIEPDSTLLNDNFGNVTLKSSYTLMTWGELSPKKMKDVTVTAKEMCIKDTGEAGTYTIEYQMKAANEQKIEETYNVSETITVWTFKGEHYVLAYGREVQQVWIPDANSVGNSFIDLGIQNSTDIEHVESNNGQYIAYAINGDVYCMDLKGKEITQVYIANAESISQAEKTISKVIDVDDEGNVDFMICGYDRTSAHTGKNGLSVCKYSLKDNSVKEVAFIPYTESTAILKEQLSQLCYVNDGALYIMFGKDLYYVNFSTEECGTIVTGLTDGCYAINAKGTAIAYNTSLNQNDSNSITVVDLTTGIENVIQAGKGNRIKICGYTGENLVYGISDKSPGGKKKGSFLIKELVIVGSNYKKVTSYSKNNVYITDVNITDSIINMKRQKSGKAISDDQLIDNTVKEKGAAEVSYFADNVKLHVLAIAFNNRLDSSKELSVKKVKSTKFSADTEIGSKMQIAVPTQFYVYAYGKLHGIYVNQNKAQSIAKEVNGLVVNNNGQKIWTFEENYK